MSPQFLLFLFLSFLFPCHFDFTPSLCASFLNLNSSTKFISNKCGSKNTDFLAINGTLIVILGVPNFYESGIDFPSSGDFLESKHKLVIGDEFSALLWMINPGLDLGREDNNILALDVSELL